MTTENINTKATTTAQTMSIKFNYLDVEMTQEEIQNRINDLKETSNKYRDQLFEIRDTVRNTFKEQITNKKDSAEFDWEEANELLESIGASKLTSTWSGTVTFTVNVTGVEADDEQEAYDLINEALTVEWADQPDGAEFSVDDESVDDVCEEN